MIIQLRDLDHAKGQTLALDGTVDMNGMVHPDIQAFEGFSFHGQAHKEGKMILVEGVIEGAMTARCSKCLDPVRHQALTVPFKETFSEEVSEENEASDVHPVHSGKIDLDPYFRESILLEIPLVFACRDECQGLCPACGINRNKESCTCVNERIDPRLADLALFFNKDDST